ncbi:hypothetical protein CS542_06870 [Pedobacter sp. IW39]|nr:hypothetical protein CS542_06870 [Pedobacter sp. IW39]
MTANFYEDEIQTILDKIYLSLKTHDYYQPSLLDGEAGYCLFDQFYISYTGIDAVNHADNVEISKIIKHFLKIQLVVPVLSFPLVKQG